MLIGWPGIISSLAFPIAGVIRSKPLWLVSGAILTVPFSWYLSGTPLFRYTGLLLPVFQLGAAVAIHRNVQWLAWLLILPFTGIAAWLAIVVLTQ